MNRLIRKLLPLSEQGYKSVRLGILAVAFKNICEFLPFLIIYLLIEAVIVPVRAGGVPDAERILRLTLYGVLAAFVTLFASWLRDRANNIPTYREMNRLRRAAGERLRKAPMSFINARSSGEIIGNLMSDCAACEVAMSSAVPFLVADLISTAAALVILAFVDFRLMLAAACVIPVAFAIQISSLRLQARLTAGQVKAKRTAYNTMLEYIEGMPVIKAYGLSGDKFEQLKKDLSLFYRLSLRLELTAGIFVFGAEVLLQLGIGIVIFTSCMLLSKGSISVMTAILFVLVVMRIYDPVASAIGDLSNLVYMRESLKRLRELFDVPLAGQPEGSLEAFDISFSDVCFGYGNTDEDGSEERNVLDHITFEAPEGKITAIAGRSGEGKSTILRLIMRLWDADGGTIRIGGIDISGMSIESLNRYISIVDQDIVLFNDTVMNNIRIGKPDATKEEVIAAAEAARCGEFIAKLPDGYDTMIAENGRSLSGGERQRLSIARAIIKDAPILLLDEPTAYLDPESEELVQEALYNLLHAGKTVIIVAHRISTIADADKILIIDGGRIAEEGTHEQLFARNGIYRKLYDLQNASENWTVSR